MNATHLPADAVNLVAVVPFALGAAVIVIGVLRATVAGSAAGHHLAQNAALGLELFLAAGLIRLTAAPDFETLGVVAAAIAARRVIGLGIRYGERARA